MLYSRSNNNRITNFHERYIPLIYYDKSSSYKKLLQKDRSVTIHQRNILGNAIEMFKNLNGMFQEINNDIFVQRAENHINLNHENDFLIPHIGTVYSGIKNLYSSVYSGIKSLARFWLLFLLFLSKRVPLTPLKIPDFLKPILMTLDLLEYTVFTVS